MNPLKDFIAEKTKDKKTHLVREMFAFCFPFHFTMCKPGTNLPRKVYYSDGTKSFNFPVFIHVTLPCQEPITADYAKGYAETLLQRINKNIPGMNNIKMGGDASSQYPFNSMTSVNEFLLDRDAALLVVTLYPKAISNGSLFNDENSDVMKLFFTKYGSKNDEVVDDFEALVRNMHYRQVQRLNVYRNKHYK